jgi:hypothetical protein
MIGLIPTKRTTVCFMKTRFLHRGPAGLALWAGLISGSAITAGAVPVTFQVNMEIQAVLGTFSAGAGHTVEVHGSFDGWGPGRTLAASASNPNVYEVAIDIAGNAGTQVQYKFVINQAGTQVWENNGVGPGGAQNRSFNLPAAAETLPVVYFNNQTTPPGVVAVTFQINMSVQQSLGNFNPTGGHTVEAHGSFDNWGPGIALTADPNNASLYQGTVNINGSAGAPFENKFVINQSGTLVWEGNVGPGGPNGNRTFVLGTSPQTLPVVYFNNLTNDPGAGIPVTFRLNMGVQIARGTFDPTSGTVTVAGQFNNWSTSASPLTNTVANPSLFVGTVNINSVPPGGSVGHKFVLNGSTWEAGDNRAFTLESPSQTLPVEYFDRVADLGPISIVVVAPDPFQVTVSWTAGSRIRLQKSTNLNGPWEDVPGTLGQDSAFFDLTFEDERPSTFFRLAGP